MADDVLSAEESAALVVHEARIAQVRQVILDATHEVSQAWACLRREYKALHLEAYLLTRWDCDACGEELVCDGLPRRKRCPKCEDWMLFQSLVKPATYVEEVSLRLVDRLTSRRPHP